MESDEDDEETQASFCRFLDDNFKLPISAYAPGCVPKVKIKERLFIRILYSDILYGVFLSLFLSSLKMCDILHFQDVMVGDLLIC